VEAVLGAAAAAILLLALWVGATRRHLARRRGGAGDWEGAEERPDLWTSSARCPACGEPGGLLSGSEDELWFTCLACNQRHLRRHKG
jgi:hypothetical protein